MVKQRGISNPGPRKPTAAQALRQRASTKPAPRQRTWKLEDAKAKFSEVVRRARTEGPQRVTYRGEDAVVVVAAQEFDRLQPPAGKRLSFVEFMRTLAPLAELDTRRSRDRGRNIDLDP
jgi:prevent-host-death family protein